MATRGRKPKPTALHALAGTTNVTRHRNRVAEPVPEGNLDEPPDWLSPGQKLAWRYAMTHAPRNLLRRIDRGVLLVWVEAEERHRIATEQQTKIDIGNAMPLLSARARPARRSRPPISASSVAREPPCSRPRPNSGSRPPPGLAWRPSRNRWPDTSTTHGPA